MARPLQPGDRLPVNPPLKVIRTHTRDDGHLVVDVEIPDDHPLRAALVADALRGISVADVEALIGHPGLPEDDRP